MNPEYGALLPDVMRKASRSLVSVPRVFHEAREELDTSFLFQVRLKHDQYRKFIGTVDSLVDNKIYFASSLEDKRVKELQEKIDANTRIRRGGVDVLLSMQDMFDLQNVFDEFHVFINYRNPKAKDHYDELREYIEKAFNKASDPKWGFVRKVGKNVGRALSQRGEL